MLYQATNVSHHQCGATQMKLLRLWLLVVRTRLLTYLIISGYQLDLHEPHPASCLLTWFTQLLG